jgi:hypothetical protein
MQNPAFPHFQLETAKNRPMEDDDAEMADDGTDDADDVDPNYDAKARPQQGSESTVEILSRRSCW